MASSITVAAAAADPKSFASRLRLLLDADDGAGASGDPAAVEDLLRVGEGALEVAAARDGADEWLSRAEGVLDAAAFVAENCLADGAAGAALSLGALASSESGAASAALWRLGLPDAAVTVLERAAKATARAAKLAEASGDDDGGGGGDKAEAKRTKKKGGEETEEDREAKRELRRRSSSGIYATAASFALDDDDGDGDLEGGGGHGGGSSFPSSPSAGGQRHRPRETAPPGRRGRSQRRGQRRIERLELGP